MVVADVSNAVVDDQITTHLSSLAIVATSKADGSAMFDTHHTT